MPKRSGFRTFLTKLTHWEYWPFSVIYFPVYFYYGWLALRARSFFFFTASNPTIHFGGMFGERKSDIFRLIPDEYIPRTELIPVGAAAEAKAKAAEIGFPLIAKPDIGERGILVSKIENEKELREYVAACPVNFLLQEFVDFPTEVGVFFVKMPGQEGRVTSIVRKDFLKVIGDGQSTITQLLEKLPRALVTADLESDFLKANGNDVPLEGQAVLVEPIGNHCRGTKFLDDTSEIDEGLNQAIERIASQIPDFYFGRFDIRCKSLDSLRRREDFKILELNGAGSEPGHIYQPGYSLIQAYRDILWHLRVLTDISIENHKRGVPYWSFREGYKMWRSHQKYNRQLQ